MTTNDILSRAKAAADGVRTNLAAAHDLVAEARLPFIRRELEKRAHAMGCLADRHPASHGYRVEATAYAESLAVLNASPEAKAARIARRSRIKRTLSGYPSSHGSKKRMGGPTVDREMASRRRS